jgi:hypothetical protein
MSRWFRHYAGMMRDEKLVRAAVKAKQPVERVVWVWGAILESAAEKNDGGLYEFDVGEAAYFLRCDESDLAGILASLEALGRLCGGVVARWGDRQFSSDTAAERQRRYRERKSHGYVQDDDGERNGDAQSHVTPPSRDAAVTPQETEEDTETERYKPPASVEDPGAREFSELLEVFPRNQQCSETRALAAWQATKVGERPAILAAARRRALWIVEDSEARGRTVDASKRFEPFLANWLESGDWKKPLVLKADAQQPDPNLEVLAADDPVLKAIERRRGKPFAIGDSGRVTVRKTDAEAARKELAA